jgi:hypothetical protein
MSDTYNVRITATETASPAFRKIAAEAQKTDHILDGMGDGALKALQAIERNTGEAAASLQKFGQAAQQAETRTKGLDDGLTKLGAGAGSAVAGIAKLGSAYVNQERQLDSLRRQYGDAGSEIIDFTEHLQDSTRYSNDAARDAASLAAVLTTQYKLSTQQVEDLLARTADLAQTSGLSFVDAAERTTSAIRGEAESAERLNLTLSQSQVAAYAAAQAQIDNASGLDQAAQAQLRYQLFMEQSTYAQGAAGAAAQTAAGQTQQLVNQLQDGAQALGGFLGPAGEVASVLGEYGLQTVVVGAGLGKLATGAKAAGTAMSAAQVGGVGLMSVLGPVGIGVAAVAAAAGVVLLVQHLESLPTATEQAAATLGDLDTAYAQFLSTVGDTDAQAGFKDVTDNLSLLLTQSLDTTDRAEEQLREFGNSADEALAQIASAFSRPGINGEALAAAFDDVFNRLHDGAIGGEAAAEAIAHISDQWFLYTDAALAAAGATGTVMSANDLLAESYQRLLTDIQLYQDTSFNGATSEDQISRNRIAHARALEDQAANARTYGQEQQALLLEQEARDLRNLNRADEYDRQVTANDQKALDARQAVLDQRHAMEEQNAAYGETLNARRQQDAERERALGEARVASARQVMDSYRDALFTPIDAPFLAGLDDMVAAGRLQEDQAGRIEDSFDRLQMSGASTLEVFAGLGQSMYGTSSASVAMAAGLDRTASSLGEANDLIIGTTNNLSGLLNTSAGLATGLFDGDPSDGMGPLVDLLNEGLITQEEFNTAREQGLQILENQRLGELSINEIRADQLGYIEEQTAAYDAYLAKVADRPEAEQRRVLYLQDATNQQNLLNTETALYAASIDELPDEYVANMILNRAAWDPEYAAILEEQGVLERDPITQEYRVVIPDGTSTVEVMTSLNSTLGELTDVLRELGGLPDPFGPMTDKASALAALRFDNLKDIGHALHGLPLPGSGRPGDGTGDLGGTGTRLPTGGVPANRATAEGGTGTVGRPYPGPLPPNIPPTPRGGTTDMTISYRIEAIDEASPTLNRVKDNATALNGSKALLDALANDEASPKLAAVADAFDGLDGKSATLLALGDSGSALGAAVQAGGAYDGLNGKSATLLALGDSGSAVGAAAVAGGSFDGINGKSSYLYALGDSSGAENAAAAGAGAIYSVDGISALMTVEGQDNYSGVVNAAAALSGAILATSYVDIYTREFKSVSALSGLANGGLVDGYADGGVMPSAALGRVLVGENGPEIATLPGGTLITPSPASRQIAERMRSGGDTHNHFYLQGTYVGVEDFAGAMADAMTLASQMERRSLGGT